MTRREENLESLRQELARVRSASLAASRKGDYMRVARLTSIAANLNRFIIEEIVRSEVDAYRKS